MTHNTCNFGNGQKNSSSSFVEALFDMFNTGMNNFMEQTENHQESSSTAFQPRLNVIKGDNAYELELLIPGAQKEDIKIAYDSKLLTITYSKEKSNKHYMKKEFGFDNYERKIRVRPNMDLDNMDANYNNGVLTLNIPKKSDHNSDIKEVNVN